MPTSRLARPRARTFRRTLVLTAGAALLAMSCSSGGGRSIRCSFANPAQLDESATSWVKFRRDRQNTGVVRLDAAAYARIAAGDVDSPATRTLVWMYPRATAGADSAFVASPVLNPAADTLYIGSTGGRLLGIHTSGGDAGSLVSVEVDNVARDYLAAADPFAITTAALAATRDDLDAVFVGAGSGVLFGVAGDGSTLDRIWPSSADTFVGTGVNLGLDGTLFAGSLGSGLYAVCPNGVPRFSVFSGSTVSSPAIGRDAANETFDGTVYFGADDGLLRAVYGNGLVAWSFNLSAPILAAPIVLLDGAEAPSTLAIFAVDSKGRLVRVTPAGRAAPGFASPAGLGRVSASPALVSAPGIGQRLYVASKDTGLHAVDAQTGALIWSLDIGTGIDSSPAVALDLDGASAPIIVFGADDGRLHYVRDAGESAERIASFTPQSTLPIVSSPAVGPDGTVYFGGLDGRVYAID